MALAGTWFREGKATFADFVEIQSSVYNFQLSIARARADYGKALAQLQTLVGQPVDEGCSSQSVEKSTGYSTDNNGNNEKKNQPENNGGHYEN